MKLPNKEDCIHFGMCKYAGDCMCPMDCGYFEEAVEWISVKDRLPDRIPNARYSQVPCLVVKNNEVQILVFNHEHMVWDDADGDDFNCQIGDVSFWMPIPEEMKL